jgi:hypothetical protein
LSCEYPSSTTVPKAGKRLLETDVKFLISPLDRLLYSKGTGDGLVSDDIFAGRNILYFF